MPKVDVPMADENRESQLKVPEVIIAPSQPASVQLKQALMYRIAIGLYPPGSKLPSVRQLAESLGVNRNTVSKVYRELARENLVRMVPGKGVFVIATHVREIQENSIREQVAQSVEAMSRQARLYGLTREELTQLVLRVVDQTDQRQGIKLAFVECNIPDTEEMARDLEFYLNMKVHSLLLADFVSQSARYVHEFDLICTTFYHLAELSQLIPEHHDRIVALQVTPRPEVLLQISRYGPQHRLGLVVSNQRTLDSMMRVVQTCSEALVEFAFTSDEKAVLELAERSDAIIDTLGSHELFVRVVPGKPTITVTYHPDNQSLEYLRYRILQCLQVEAT